MRTTVTLNLVAVAIPSSDYAGAIRSAFPSIDVVWKDGTGDDQADDYFYDSFTASGGAETYDLNALTPGPEGSGDTVSLAEVRLLAVKVADDAPGPVHMAVPGSNGWDQLMPGGGDALILEPGATFVLISPNDGEYTVTAPDSQLTFTQQAGDSDVELLIVGASA